MADIFVSYKAEDRRRIKPLVEALQADGYSVWWDEQIGGGTAWRHAIEAELNAARCVIVVWSERSVTPEGTFVQDEATRAQERHVYVPVTIDNVHLPLGFGETQAVALTGWRGNRSDRRYEAVLAAVRRIVGGAAAPRSTQAPSVDRRSVIAASAIAALAAAGAGGWFLFKPQSGAGSASIAVLPFENLSGDPAQAYFSDGVAEEIRSALARIGLQVVGRTSSEAVKSDDAETAAKKLGVANILTGSVRRSPTMIRVSAQLIKGSNGLERWSQDYDRAPGDVLGIQSDIAQNVAEAMSVALGKEMKAQLTIGGTANPAAHDLYLKGLARLSSEDSEQALRSALAAFDGAIALDPKYAIAYGAKAAALNELIGAFSPKGARFDFAPAAALARQAIALEPDLADAHGVLASILMNALDVAGAGAEFAKARALPGTDAIILMLYSGFLALIGNENAALAVAHQAEARDPLNPDIYSAQAYALGVLGRNSQSAGARRKALQLAPARALDRTALAYTLMLSGQYEEAASELAKTPKDFLGRLVGEAMLSARRADLTASDQAIARLQQLYGDTADYQYAEIFAQRGEKDRAFAALDRAWAVRDPGLNAAKTDNLLEPLRPDPRFTLLLRRMNFPA